MTDDELDRLLRGYRAADPASDLRDRVLRGAAARLAQPVTPHHHGRLWLVGAAAAAAVLAVVTASAADRTYRSIASVISESSLTSRDQLVALLAADIGGPDARDEAERMVRAHEQDMAQSGVPAEAVQ